MYDDVGFVGRDWREFERWMDGRDASVDDIDEWDVAIDDIDGWDVVDDIDGCEVVADDIEDLAASKYELGGWEVRLLA